MIQIITEYIKQQTESLELTNNFKIDSMDSVVCKRLKIDSKLICDIQITGNSCLNNEMIQCLYCHELLYCESVSTSSCEEWHHTLCDRYKTWLKNMWWKFTQEGL